MQNIKQSNTVELSTRELIDVALHLALYRARLELAGADVTALRQLEQRLRSMTNWAMNSAVRTEAA